MRTPGSTGGTVAGPAVRWSTGQTSADRFIGIRLYPLRRVLPGGAHLPDDGNSKNPHPVYDRATSRQALQGAWNYLLARDARDGDISAQSRMIMRDPDAFIEELARQLSVGTYLPEPLVTVTIPKPKGGGTRTLNIPTMRDRIVERAVVDTITFDVELVQSACSFAYRGGIGRDDAIHLITTMRDEGLPHVLRTDIQDFFGHVNIDDALAQLPAALNEPAFLELLHLIGRPRRSTGNRRVRTRGIPQGSSLSPLIANLALTDVDNAMCDAGYGYVRFADDIVVCGESPARVAEARARLSAILNQRGFTLSEEKTAVTTFDDGFCYLGASFNGRSPRTDPLHDIKGSPDPDSVVYVGRDGTRVHLSKGRLVVDSESGIPQMSIPQRAITRIVLTGNVGLSAGARSWALYNDIDVVCLSRHGHYLGQLAGPKTAANAARLLAQASFSSDREKRLPLAKAIITAKVRNQVHVLNRIARRAPSLALQDITARMRSWKGDVAHAGTVDEVMGLEGAASSAYFDALALCVPEGIEFNGRSRRPPLDLPNAALSYLYAVLLSECAGALFCAGLEPSLGVLHASTDKRPSLALDLMEEFRPLLVDQTVMALLRTRRLRAEHATLGPEGKGVWLNKDGKRIVVGAYEATVQRSVKGALPGFAGTWRHHIHHEAQLLGRAILEDGYRWTGVAWR